MEARANKVRRRSIRKARKQTRDRIRRNVRRKVAEMAFGRTHFGAAVLGDKRRTDRLVKMADTIAMHPGGTLPDKFKTPAELEAVYRLMNNEAVTHEAVIASHCALTRQRMAEEPGVVLVLHDTTELQYTTLKSIKDLGPVGNGLDRGYLCHNSLAVVPGTRQVLGLASQILHTRRKVPAKETAQQKREHPDRESRLWKRGCEAVGPAAPGQPLRILSSKAGSRDPGVPASVGPSPWPAPCAACAESGWPAPAPAGFPAPPPGCCDTNIRDPGRCRPAPDP